jgi:hypothetical protein
LSVWNIFDCTHSIHSLHIQLIILFRLSGRPKTCHLIIISLLLGLLIVPRRWPHHSLFLNFLWLSEFLRRWSLLICRYTWHILLKINLPRGVLMWMVLLLRLHLKCPLTPLLLNYHLYILWVRGRVVVLARVLLCLRGGRTWARLRMMVRLQQLHLRVDPSTFEVQVVYSPRELLDYLCLFNLKLLKFTRLLLWIELHKYSAHFKANLSHFSLNGDHFSCATHYSAHFPSLHGRSESLISPQLSHHFWSNKCPEMVTPPGFLD